MTTEFGYYDDLEPGLPEDGSVELLDEEPATINRPLAFVNGITYAATWPVVRVRGGGAGSSESTRRRLVIVRDDGVLFGEGLQPINDLKLDVHLRYEPPADKLWSAAGVRRYMEAERPKPAVLFEQVVSVIDHFVDFEQSLAPQRDMCELVACYILATWFLDAFNVIGFLWPSGDRGSGKTKLLQLVASLSYLGQVILAGGTYATLRDLADYGATLAFDDAEMLGDPKRGDPNKRNLLLAGNRRGSRVTLKERQAGQWRTRYVNTYCARLFSATRLPDPILASRTIVIPLVRTPDRARANAEPLDAEAWPCDRARLLDDLWAMGLFHLPMLPGYEHMVAQTVQLTGRGLERWRAILAVAHWVQGIHIPGLSDRMTALALAHQAEQTTLETPDLTVLVVKALLELVAGLLTDNRLTSADALVAQIIFPTAAVTELVRNHAEDSDVDVDPRTLTSTQVGAVLNKLRLKEARNKKQRGWELTLPLLLRLAAAYAIPIPDNLRALAPAAPNPGAPAA